MKFLLRHLTITKMSNNSDNYNNYYNYDIIMIVPSSVVIPSSTNFLAAAGLNIECYYNYIDIDHTLLPNA